MGSIRAFFEYLADCFGVQMSNRYSTRLSGFCRRLIPTFLIHKFGQLAVLRSYTGLLYRGVFFGVLSTGRPVVTTLDRAAALSPFRQFAMLCRFRPWFAVPAFCLESYHVLRPRVCFS